MDRRPSPRRALPAVAAALLAAGMLAVGAARAQNKTTENAKSAEIVGHALHVPAEAPTPERVAALRHPPGFAVETFAEGLENPRWMAVADDGTVFVTEPKPGKVVALRPGRDGRAGAPRTVLDGLPGVHGIALKGGRLFVATPTRIFAAELRPDGALGALETVVDDLPDGGQHGKRTIAFGPDGMLYISVGSTCNACQETNEENATMLRVAPDGGRPEIFARGLRNTLGFAWEPKTGALYGMDQGADWRGDDQPPEELNRIAAGKNYGWPECYGDRHPDPERPPTDPAGCGKTEPPVLTYQAHAAPIGMVFYEGAQFPEEYRGDAFVAFRGSWNRQPPAGYRITRVRFEDGKPVAFEDFLTGFLVENGTAQIGRLAGLAVAKDGSLLVADDSNGAIYRIAYAPVASGSSSR